MKKLIFLLLLVSTSTVFSQTYRFGEMSRETFDGSWSLINKELYAYNVSVIVNADKSYTITCKTIGFGIDFYNLKYVKTTGKGAKYHDDIKGDFYVEDNLAAFNSFKLTNSVNKNFVVLSISNLKKQKEDD